MHIRGNLQDGWNAGRLGRLLGPLGYGCAIPRAVLELIGVEYAYTRTPALRGVELHVDAGEVVAVTGPSGCGKSTLLHVAAGILPAQLGVVRLLGYDLTALSEAQRAALRRRDVGVVLQFGQLVPDLAAVENVALPLLLDGWARGRALRAAAGWLDRVGIGQERDTLAAELSGGESQRVAVARALVTEPEIVFADEPTGSLDQAGGFELLELLVGEAGEGGVAVVIVTHDRDVAARADREVRLLDGRLDMARLTR
ncbi:ABC transporter ATP-binding protein [Solirubrobacter sp. CPCC 204708]|uniref:ABC transporter ATP-binding protein n=1 Tax=Solirubrobacter deserti TaxID=2282478 RepID=A0ABT4RLW9_9ACTN|nr:ABC transporter ATP-binding protein [Solirubrobacter deserti]MDA0139571.1 ABC transporter ATP-binding protein [Solirubrobacter deserti]